MSAVLIVGGNAHARAALAAGLAADGLQVVESLADAANIAIAEVLEDVDVVVVSDDSGPGKQRLRELLQRIANVPLVMLTDDPDWAERLSRRREGWALAPRDTPPRVIGAIARAAVAGLVTLPVEWPHAGPSSTSRSEPDDQDGTFLREEALTPREREVLALLADGLSNRAIAGRLGISEHTVKFHVSTIYGKLGAANRAEAVARGWQKGLIAL
jgi:DNA-binding NarL/FixJ family response regulator